MIKDEIYLLANNFLSMAFSTLEEKQFILEEHWHIDHLCYRTSTPENYLRLKNYFEKFSSLLIESEVNGRLISTFKLPYPIIYKHWEIDLIEIPAPKKGKLTVDGFEHFEIVCDIPFDEIRTRYNIFQFKDNGLSKLLNQELEVSFENFSLKFHHLSLESVINLEQNKLVQSAIEETNLLKILKPFNPLIAGTFPLKLDTNDSDLDILISSKDFDLVKKIALESLSIYPQFKYSELIVNGEPSLNISFIYQTLKVDVFVQKTPSIRQRGYLHFLIEERILKIAGDSLREKIKQLRNQGLKTEPAFSQAMQLKEDPFEELLLIQKKSNQNLKELLLNRLK
ncbi:MAG: VOC family protein [Bdellovibrionales bacterium]|nr:VOC family protein [Bdellovibrionales bacterium]